MAEQTAFQQVYDYANRSNPYPLYAELRKTPVALQADGSYVVSSYWEILTLLHDPRISSDARNRPAAGAAPVTSNPEEDAALDAGFLLTDPPLHDRLRRLAMR